jgi:intermediate peptidase
MLARTDFQHIAGTRCALDFVEVPSILMEYFAKNPYILSCIASDSSNKSVPTELFKTHFTNSTALESLETHHQIQLAVLDQVYHSSASLERFTGQPSSSFASSTDILCAVQSKLNVFEYVPGTSPQTHFTHLLTYGASYYSYFWSRKWAKRLWTELFEKSLSNLDDRSNNYELLERLALDDGRGGGWRRGGDLLKQELLGVGGGRDPWVGLEALGIVHESERQK